ncbi:winged helix-turn-helix transcriptional regulator [Candidatus Woesearchaeota archaeon]|nr:winged helix-turn-helix transcriptional regulator [Candidatus Woesearchaeota archaeon]
MTSLDIDVEQHMFCLETLANELRLDIIRLLNDGKAMNVNQLAEATKAERSRVSHALANLKQCKLVIVEKKGREMRYSLDESTPLFKQRKGNIFDMIEEHARTQCPTCKKYQNRVNGKK